MKRYEVRGLGYEIAEDKRGEKMTTDIKLLTDAELREIEARDDDGTTTAEFDPPVTDEWNNVNWLQQEVTLLRKRNAELEAAIQLTSTAHRGTK